MSPNTTPSEPNTRAQKCLSVWPASAVPGAAATECAMGRRCVRGSYAAAVNAEWARLIHLLYAARKPAKGRAQAPQKIPAAGLTSCEHRSDKAQSAPILGRSWAPILGRSWARGAPKSAPQSGCALSRRAKIAQDLERALSVIVGFGMQVQHASHPPPGDPHIRGRAWARRLVLAGPG
jgi:hypothetical protein